VVLKWWYGWDGVVERKIRKQIRNWFFIPGKYVRVY